jgi:hypothetical protein
MYVSLAAVTSHPKLALTMTAVTFSFLPQDDLLVMLKTVNFLKSLLGNVSQILFLQHSNFLRKGIKSSVFPIDFSRVNMQVPSSPLIE